MRRTIGMSGFAVCALAVAVYAQAQASPNFWDSIDLFVIKSDRLIPAGDRGPVLGGVLKAPKSNPLPPTEKEKAIAAFAEGKQYFIWRRTDQLLWAQDSTGPSLPPTTSLGMSASAVAATGVTGRPFAVIAQFAVGSAASTQQHVFVCSPMDTNLVWQSTNGTPCGVPIFLTTEKGQILTGSGEVAIWLASAPFPVDWREENLKPISNKLRFLLTLDRSASLGALRGGRFGDVSIPCQLQPLE